MYFHFALWSWKEASPCSLVFFFFLFNFPLCKEKIPKFLVSSYFVWYKMTRDVPLIFILFFITLTVVGERFWQGWRSIRPCFLFIPSENWIGSSISPDEGGSSADSYYLLKFFSLIQSFCHPRFNLELNLVFETFSFTRIACQLSNKSFPYFYP